MLNNSVRIPGPNLLVVLCMVLMAIVLLFAVSVGSAQEKNVKTVPIKFTSPDSAKEMYTEYCAACHGADGKGNGPAASEFKQPPTNLTTLSKKNNGDYPADKIYLTLKFGTNTPAHGTLKMPIWMDLFRSLDSSDGFSKLRMHNLVEYIRTIQVI
jgi:mono/diheme cytochrome c family protein